VRDDDGLALSSRNVYLSPEERRRGLSLSRALHAMQQRAERGETSARALVELGRGTLDCDRLDYLAVTDAETLKPLDEVGDRPARVLVAAWIGSTRLIDNVPIGRELAWT
jgi:pantoate--beta-alanine ligase